MSPSFGRTSPESRRQIETAGATLVQADEKQLSSRIDSVRDSVRALIVGTQSVDADFLGRFPNLVIVAKHGSGLDNVDIDAATAAEVVVTNAPGANAVAVAELTLGLIISLARSIPFQDARVRQNQWTVATGRALEGSTLGIVGLGKIGQLVAVRAHAFDMRILAFDMVTKPYTPRDPWTYTAFDTLLRQSDFVTLHVPLTDRTERLIDTRALHLMKSTAYLINTSRGNIVDEESVDVALRNGEIAGAAFDVFSEEPLGPEHPLIKQRERTILTPHMGGYTETAIMETSIITARNVVAALRGEWPPNAVNIPRDWQGEVPQKRSATRIERA